MRALALLLCAATTVAAESLADSTLWFFAGPAYHFVPESEHATYLQEQWGIDLTEPNHRGGSLGFTWEKNPKSLRELSVAIYGAEGRSWSRGAHVRYRVYSLEGAWHARLHPRLSIYFSNGVAWVAAKENYYEAEILTWPISAGARLLMNRSFIDVRYRYLGLKSTRAGVGRRFYLGGWFLTSGFLVR